MNEQIPTTTQIGTIFGCWSAIHAHFSSPKGMALSEAQFETFLIEARTLEHPARDVPAVTVNPVNLPIHRNPLGTAFGRGCILDRWQRFAGTGARLRPCRIGRGG